MDAAARSESFLVATLDVLLSAAGLLFVTFPAAVAGDELLAWAGIQGFPLPDATLHLLIGVVALGGAYPLVTGDWSLGRLGDFVFALTAGTLAVGVLGMVVVLVGDLTVSGENPLPRATMVAGGYAVAYLLVYRGATRRRSGRSAVERGTAGRSGQSSRSARTGATLTALTARSSVSVP